MSDWFVYLLEMSDGSYYCGIAQDVAARIKDHKSGKGSKYVRSRLPIKTVVAVSTPIVSRSEAQKLEAEVKALPKCQKAIFLEGWSRA